MNKWIYKLTGLLRLYICKECGRLKIETNSHAEVCDDCYFWSYYLPKNITATSKYTVPLG